MKKIAAAAVILALSHPALADDFTDTLDTARKAYEEGDIAAAKEELEYASQLLGQQRLKALQSFLPEAPDGWSRKLTKGSGASGASILGGGTSASAKYVFENDRITISIVTDSPMIQGMSMMFSNAAFAGANGEMKRINRQKVMVKGNGDITALIDKRIMVEVKGKAPADDKEMFFKAIDIKKLKSY